MKILLSLLLFVTFLDVAWAREKVTFSKCVDGDTIKVMIDDEEKTVRLLAVDTPESVHPTKGVEYYGKEASDYTCKIISEAKIIELEYDEGSDREDKYDRLLAWVFVDDVLLQDELIKNGYAEVAYLYGDYKYTSLLQDHQRIAEASEIGIWNEAARMEFDSGESADTDKKQDEDKTLENMTMEDYIIWGVSLVVAAMILPLVKRGKKKIKKLLK